MKEVKTMQIYSIISKSLAFKPYLGQIIQILSEKCDLKDQKLVKMQLLIRELIFNCFVYAGQVYLLHLIIF